MGLEYISQPQVFLSPITAVNGVYGINDPYPLLTTYQSWTSTAVVNASAFPIPGAWTMLDEPGSFIVTVGGVIQPPSEYTIDRNFRILTFNSIVSAGVEIGATQLATAAPSSQNFNYVQSVSANFTNLSGVNGRFDNLFVTSLTALTSILQITDIQLYETSGFNVNGSVNVTGTLTASNTILTNLTASNIVLPDNGTLLGATSATSINIGTLSARTFSLIHEPANDGVDPILDIGETQTGSFSGFRIRYEEPTNRLIGSSRTGTTVLTSFMIDTTTGQVGVSGLPAPGQALTVAGNVSASGQIIGSNTDNYFILSANRTALGSVTAAYFDPAIAINLLPSKQYYVQYDLYHAKDTQAGGLNYILSSNNTFANIVASYLHKSELTATGGPTQQSGLPGRIGPAVVLPTITTIAATLTSYTYIKSTIESGTLGNTFVLAVSSAGNIIPLRGSTRKVTLIN